VRSSGEVLTSTDANQVECLTEMENNAEALTTLGTYARAVPAGFFPYFRDTWELTTRSVQEEYPIVVKLVSAVMAEKG